MEIAECWARVSPANRLKVGAVLVKDGRIISSAYNGTPAGYFTNNCEDENNKTIPQVLHAESNAITKVAKSTESSVGSTLFITHSPCFECAKLIIQAGIVEVVFRTKYTTVPYEPIKELLIDCGVKVKWII